MANFAVVRLTPPDFGHGGIFTETSEAICHGLRALGHHSVLADNQVFGDCINIVFAPHLLRHFGEYSLPPQTVAFNLEPIIPEMLERLPGYLDLLRLPRLQHIWDYDRRNIAKLAQLGIGKARLVQIGHAPELARITSAAEQDIDVLFYGSPTPRRLAVRDSLQRAGLEVRFEFGIYGAERDALIARAKVVLSVAQFGGEGVFDVVRLAYLLANSKCVVAENGVDAALEQEYGEAVAFTDYAELAAECSYFCSMDEERRGMERRGLEWFSRRPQSDFLRGPVTELLEAAP